MAAARRAGRWVLKWTAPESLSRLKGGPSSRPQQLHVLDLVPFVVRVPLDLPLAFYDFLSVTSTACALYLPFHSRPLHPPRPFPQSLCL